MTEEAPKTAAKKASATKFMLPIVLVILLVAALGFVAKMDKGIDAQLVEAELNSLIASAQKQYPATRIVYDEVQMGGGASDRHALVQNVRVVVDVFNADREPAELEFAFPELKIQPKSTRFDTFDVTPTKGLVITEDGEVSAFTFTPAPTATITQSSVNGGVRADYTMPLAGVWRITKGEMDEAQAETGEPLPAVDISFSDPSSVSGHTVMGEQQSGSVTLDLAALQASHTQDESEKLGLASLKFDSNWKQTDEQRGAASASLSVADLFSTEEEMPYGAISIEMEGDYDGPMPSEEREIDWSSEKALVDLRRFSIAAKEVALNGRLNFQTGRGELLPVGEGQIDVKNFAYVLAELRANEMLEDQSEKLLGVLAQQITGEKLDEITDLSVPIKRVDGGSLQIGQSNFEELFAIFLTGGKINPQHSPAEAPAVDGESEAGEAIDESEVKELFNEQ